MTKTFLNGIKNYADGRISLLKVAATFEFGRRTPNGKVFPGMTFPLTLVRVKAYLFELLSEIL